MLSSEVLGQLRTWPIEIRLFGRSGYTIWAEGEVDLLLATGGKLVAFRTRRGLIQFMAGRQGSSLSKLPGYMELSQIVMGRGFAESDLVPFWSCDFDDVSGMLSSEPWSAWTLGECSDVLTCLNMLWDMAMTQEDMELVAHLRSTGPLGELADALTFMTDKELSGLSRFNPQAISSLFNADLQAMADRIAWRD